MRLLIVGTLDGHISTAGQIALKRGAKVAHSDDINSALKALRAGQGADLGSRDHSGYLPLHWACYQKDPSLVAVLLPPETVSWQDDRQETPFMKCARLDNVAVMGALLGLLRARQGIDLLLSPAGSGRKPG